MKRKANRRTTGDPFVGKDSNDIVRPFTPEVLRKKINKILETK